MELFDFQAWKDASRPTKTLQRAQNTSEQFQLAQKIYQTQLSKFKNRQNDMLIKMATSGTTHDRISSLELLIQQQPSSCLDYLEKFVDLAEGRTKSQSDSVVGPLKQIFITLLLPKRALLHFSEIENPEANGLLQSYFEDKLKNLFLRFLRAIENSLSQTTVEQSKVQLLKHCLDIYLSTVEQNIFLLSIIVNKLGDTFKKVSSEALFSLQHLIRKKSDDSEFAVLEIERFLNRPNLSDKAKYYAMLFLNHIVFNNSPNGKKLAKTVIQVYFRFFDGIVERDETGSKVLDSLLTGIHRAFPFASLSPEESNKYLAPLWKLAESYPEFKKAFLSIQVLSKVIEFNRDLRNRFFRVLYKRISNPDWLNSTTYHTLFFQLIFRVLEFDQDSVRVAAVLKRLLQMVLYLQPSSACLALQLASKVCHNSPELAKLIKQKETELVASTLVSSSIDQSKKEKITPVYDELHNDPRWTNAHTTGLWEAFMLTNHFHPSVSKFSHQLVSNELIAYKGDPLNDFSSMNFLDRFVNKKQKKMRSEKVVEVQAEFSKPVAPARPPITKDSSGPNFDDETFFYDFYNTIKKIDEKSQKLNQKALPAPEEEQPTSKPSTRYDYSQLSDKDFQDEFNPHADEDDEEFLDQLLSDEDDEEEGGLEDQLQDEGGALGEILEKNVQQTKFKKWAKGTQQPQKRNHPQKFLKNKKFKKEKPLKKKKF